MLLGAPVLGHAATSFKNSDFSIELDSDWVQAPIRFVDHVAFVSKERNVSLKMDSAPAPLKRRTAQEAARALIERGIKREHDENKGSPVIITNHGTSSTSRGVIASYSGRDSLRAFKWVGFIENHKFVYLYFETTAQGEKQLESVVQAVLENFKVIP